MTATPRAKYLAEMQHLTARFEELAEAFQPVPGETDLMRVSVLLMRRQMQFSESILSRLKKVAEFLSDEQLAEIPAAGARRDDEAPSSHVTCSATTARAEPEETFWVLEDGDRREGSDAGAHQ
jgi:hypothetical protein